MTFDPRYSRLAALPDLGPEGVAALSKAKVLVIGCGALGSLCSMYLAASGVGYLAIADFDTIDISNLQRQLFFSERDLGKPKTEILAERVHSLNSSIHLQAISSLITEQRARRLFPEFDLIVDGSDNPATKLLTDRLTRESGRCCVIGGVKEFQGQVCSFRPDSIPYVEMFGDSPDSTDIMPCSIAGVLGPAAGVVASIQAAEAIKIITGAGDPLFNSLFTINLLDLSSSLIRFL